METRSLDDKAVPSHVAGIADGKKSVEFKVLDVKLDTGLGNAISRMPQEKAPPKAPRENR